MKRLLNYPLFLTAVAAWFFTACGEDRSGEYINLTQESRWIEQQMQHYYLWYTDMPTLEDDDYFSDPEEFFYSLLSKRCRNGEGDNFSYFESRAIESTEVNSNLTINESSSYGFDFAIYPDPTETTAHRMGRVLYVIPNSPAANAGLRRGDWIIEVGGATISEGNYEALISGGATTLGIAELHFSQEDKTMSWGETTTLNIEASRAVENNPFYCYTVFDNYQNSGKKIGYLMYDHYSPGPNETGTQYNEQMEQLFSYFKNEGVDEFILDLRYNTGGVMTCINQLCSYLIAPASLGQPLYSLQYNDKNSELNITTTTNSGLSELNLGLSTLYVITGRYTASASECTIYCLRPYMTVNLFGATTTGKNVASIGIDSPYNFTLYPIVATVYNSQNLSDYEEGITPNYAYDELQQIDRLGEIGNPDEDLTLYYMMQYVLNGTPGSPVNETAAKQPRASQVELAPEFATIPHHAVKGNIITE